MNRCSSPLACGQVEEHESDAFMQCFVSVEYLPGGVASAFNAVDRSGSAASYGGKRLLHLKGSRMVRVRPVAVSASSLCAGDVFILDDGLTIM